MDAFDDFAPSKSSSKLASIFGPNKIPVESSSLTYTAPKQPKHEASPKKTLVPGPDSASSSAKLQLLTVKTVNAFKLTNGVYQPLGKMGLTLVGCKSPPVYQLLLYKTREDVMCKIRLHQNFTFSILDNNYATFYDEDLKNYSVMFETSSDVQSFSQKLAIVKSCFSSPSAVVFQDITYSEEPELEVTNHTPAVVKITGRQLLEDQELDIVVSEETQVTRNSESDHPWIRALDGLKYGGERVIITPREFSDPWKHCLIPEAKLLLHVQLMKPDPAPSGPANEKSDTLFDSSMDSAEETSSFKERGAKIEDALSGKSLRSGLLSRVARLGQATLPLKGAVVADLTDSEEDSSPSPKPRIRSKPSSALVRDPTPRTVPKPQQVQESPRREPVQPLIQPAQPLALYQSPYQTQILMRSDATGYSQLPLVTASSLPSPSDGNLSAHFAESRAQAAELRMGISKVTDKVDLVLNKIQDIHIDRTSAPAHIQASDPTGLLASVQALVQDNLALKEKVEEQKLKLDTQNERIYHLLEMSHKSLEQNSASSKLQDGEEVKLLKQVTQLKDELNKAQNELANLSEELLGRDKKLKEIEEANLELSSRLSACEKEKSSDESVIKEAQEKINTLEIQLCQLQKENSTVKSEQSELLDQVNLLQKNTLEQVQQKESQYEQENTKLLSELTLLRKDNDVIKGELSEKLSQMKEEVERVTGENRTLKEKMDERLTEISQLKLEVSHAGKESSVPLAGDNTKVLMNVLYRNLRSQFVSEEQYSGNAIKQVLASVIRDMTLEFLEGSEKSLSKSNEGERNVDSNEMKRADEEADKDYSVTSLKLTEGAKITSMVSPVLETIAKITSLSETTTSHGEKVMPIEVEGSGPASPETKSDASPSDCSLSTTSPTESLNPQRNEPGTQSFSDVGHASGGPTSQLDKGNEVTYNQLWHTSQPPPLPAFDEDDEDVENVW